MHDASSLVRKQAQHKQQAECRRWATKKSAATICPTWFCKNERHVCDGGRRRRGGRYLATVA
jgi:hypothetical protein